MTNNVIRGKETGNQYRLKPPGFCSYLFWEDWGTVKRYSQQFKDRSVRMLVDRLAGDGLYSQWQAVHEIAPKLRRKRVPAPLV